MINELNYQSVMVRELPVEHSFHKDVVVYRCGTLIKGEVFTWAYFYELGNILFDSGCPNTARETVEEVGNMVTVLITHHHEDHIGAAPLLSRTAKIYAPRKSIELLRNPPEIPDYRKIVWGQPESFKPLPVPDRLEINGLTIEVLETPGHSFDHVTYLVGDIAFVGDLVNRPRQIVSLKGENMVETIHSLEKLLSYDIKWAYGGTGVYNRAEVEEYLEYLVDLKDRAEHLYNRGMGIEEIAGKLFPNPSRKAILFEQYSGGEWSRINLVKSLLGVCDE
ncbi:MAG: MBL fold metallo-hydrolase [Desulfurococcales archaeon]|nr:MBL fold metallo-hydrolase [Desulfurococcales archaeon]